MSTLLPRPISPLFKGSSDVREPHTFSRVAATKLVRPRSRMIAIRKSAGFNLVELMVVVALGGILLGVSTASYKYVTNANRMSTEVNALLGDLMLARSEAIKQGVNVVVCPTNSGATSCNGTTSWQTGWIVFSDPDGDYAYTAGTNDALVRVQSAFTVTSDTFQSDNSVTSITYNREGFAVNMPSNSNNYITITLHTTPSNNQWTRCLQVGNYGALATERYKAGSSCL